MPQKGQSLMILYNRRKRSTVCYNEKPGDHGWCGVCLKNAKPWTYGYCPYGGELPEGKQSPYFCETKCKQTADFFLKTNILSPESREPSIGVSVQVFATLRIKLISCKRLNLQFFLLRIVLNSTQVNPLLEAYFKHTVKAQIKAA